MFLLFSDWSRGVKTHAEKNVIVSLEKHDDDTKVELGLLCYFDVTIRYTRLSVMFNVVINEALQVRTLTFSECILI